jgi:hypothetical protein
VFFSWAAFLGWVIRSREVKATGIGVRGQLQLQSVLALLLEYEGKNSHLWRLLQRNGASLADIILFDGCTGLRCPPLSCTGRIVPERLPR